MPCCGFPIKSKFMPTACTCCVDQHNLVIVPLWLLWIGSKFGRLTFIWLFWEMWGVVVVHAVPILTMDEGVWFIARCPKRNIPWPREATVRCVVRVSFTRLEICSRNVVNGISSRLVMTNGRTVHKPPKADEWEKSKTFIETLTGQTGRWQRDAVGDMSHDWFSP